METGVVEETEVVESIYKKLDKLSGLSAHSEDLVVSIYDDLTKLFQIMQEMINEL